jgi:hypothetical protein
MATKSTTKRKPKKQVNHSVEQVLESTLCSSRLKAIQLIENMLSEKKNLELLDKAFREQFEADPVGFYKAFIHPVAVKQLDLKPDAGGNAPASLVLIDAENDSSETDGGEIDEV